MVTVCVLFICIKTASYEWLVSQDGSATFTGHDWLSALSWVEKTITTSAYEVYRKSKITKTCVIKVENESHRSNCYSHAGAFLCWDRRCWSFFSQLKIVHIWQMSLWLILYSDYNLRFPHFTRSHCTFLQNVITVIYFIEWLDNSRILLPLVCYQARSQRGGRRQRLLRKNFRPLINF